MNFLKTPRSPFQFSVGLFLFFILSLPVARATTIPTVTLNDDNLNTAGDLGSAVTTLNQNYSGGAGLQDIVFNLAGGSQTILLGSGALAGVTLLGPALLTQQASSAAPVLKGKAGTSANGAGLSASFSLGLDQSTTFSFLGGDVLNSGGNLGGGAQSGTVSVTAGSVSLGNNALFNVTGGEVNNSAAGTIIGTATAGSAWVSMGPLFLGTNSAFNVTGGEVDNDTNGRMGSTANAGSAAVTASSVTLSGGAHLNVTGGEVNDSNNAYITSTTVTGSAWVTAGSILLGPGSALSVTGGQLYNLTNGFVSGPVFTGNAWVAAASVSLVDGSSFSVAGGEDVNNSFDFNDYNASTGSGSVTLGSLSLGATCLFNVQGGELNDSSSGRLTGRGNTGNGVLLAGSITAGDGTALNIAGGELNASGGLNPVGSATGSAFVTAGSLSFGNNCALTVAGGFEDYSNFGNAGLPLLTGSAFVTAGSLSTGNNFQLNVTGGALNGSGSGTYPGVTLGSALVTVGSLSTGTGSFLNVSGGLVNNSPSGLSGDSVFAGSATLLAGPIALGAASTLAVAGGGVNNSGGTIVGNASAGNVVMSADSISLAAGSLLSVTGGRVTGGSISGTVTNGIAFLSLGDLEGSGIVTVGGNTALLGVTSGDFTGVLQGNESLAKTGTGTLILTGANSYSGGTSVSGGVLEILSDASLGAAGTTVTLDGTTLRALGSVLANRRLVLTANNGILDLNGNHCAWAGVVTGAGALGVLDAPGGGALTMAGPNNYSGGTFLQGGSLVAGSATALGTGSVVMNGGTLGMNGTNHSLTIGQDYFQGGQGTLSLGLSLIQSDRLNVGGSAYLSGGLQVSSYGGFQPSLGSVFVLMQAQGGLNGSFAQVTSLVSGSRFIPVYTANELLVETLPGSFAGLGATANQKALGADLDTLFNNPSAQGLMRSLGTLPATADYQKALQQMSPEGFAGLPRSVLNQVLWQSSFASDRMGQWRAGLGAGDSRTAYEKLGGGTPLFASTLSPGAEAQMAPTGKEGWTGSLDWGSPSFGVSGTGTGYHSAGGQRLTLEAGKRVSSHLALGFLAGYGSTGLNLDGGGSMSQSGGQLGGYATGFLDGFYLEGSAQGGYDRYTSQRQAYGGTASGRTAGDQYGGRLGVGYEFQAEGFTFGPEAAGQYTRVHVNGFTESGSQVPLTLPDQGMDSFLGTAGVRASGNIRMGDIVWAPRVGLAYEHEFNDQGGSLQAGFGQGDVFTVQGPPVGQDGWLLRAGLGARLQKGLDLEIHYEGELGRMNLTSSQLGGGLSLGI